MSTALAEKTNVSTVTTQNLAQQRPSIRQMGGIYFYSSAIAGKKNIFVTPEYLDLLVNAFKLAEIKNDVRNLAYVIMPNHFYWIFQLSENQDDPVAIYKEVKKNVTLDILRNLRQEAKDDANIFKTLDVFEGNERVSRSNPRKILWAFKEKAKEMNNGSRYRVWEAKSKLFLLNDSEKVLRNVQFIHDAPIRERWQLVAKANDYPYLYVAEEFLNKLTA